MLLPATIPTTHVIPMFFKCFLSLKKPATPGSLTIILSIDPKQFCYATSILCKTALSSSFPLGKIEQIQLVLGINSKATLHYYRKEKTMS